MYQSTPTTLKSQQSASVLHKFYSEQAQIYAERRAELQQHGLAAPAVLAGQRQIFYEDLAKQYAPKPWCPIAKRAFLFAGPGRVATGERYAAWCVKRVSIGGYNG